MAKVKSTSSGAGKFLQGGNTKMYGKGAAAPQKPGTSAAQHEGGKGKFPMGGKGKMFGKGSAGPMASGVTAKKGQ